ncbi:hypothetical protein HPB47_000205 [Ixodes persulcatus]|uniref:Uncharacterized protein n=1 Tax=Ixodes persulcatus TaxID=34615 RepID=A0AC60PSH4_IXOPE|nr:hypothetical protein HPB47_000205 [Ixodes persulcatus]
MVDDVAKMYCLTGRKGKKRFEALTFLKVAQGPRWVHRPASAEYAEEDGQGQDPAGLKGDNVRDPLMGRLDHQGCPTDHAMRARVPVTWLSCSFCCSFGMQGASLPPPTAELVGALASALRAAFHEVRPRHPHFPEVAQPVATATDDDENLIFGNFATSQDPPGRYRTRIPDPESDDSDSEFDSSPKRERGRYPRHIRPRRAPTGTRGQRLFTTTNPHTKRDFRNALIYVDRASRSSRFFGTRDVIELQLLENFLQPSRGTPTLVPPTFWEPRSPHHRPPLLHPTVQVDQPDVAAAPRKPPTVPEDATPPRRRKTPSPPTRSFASLVRGRAPPLLAPPPHPELLDSLPLWGSREYAQLPPSPPLTGSTIPVSVPPAAITPATSTLADRFVTHLNIVLDNPQPVVVSIADQQVVAVIHDIVHPPDILVQAMQAADIPVIPPSEHESLSTVSQSSSEDEDTWALAADRILHWLHDHPVVDELTDEDEPADDDDSRRPVLLAPSEWQPVRHSVPPPMVD